MCSSLLCTFNVTAQIKYHLFMNYLYYFGKLIWKLIISLNILVMDLAPPRFFFGGITSVRRCYSGAQSNMKKDMINALLQ